MRDKCLGIMIMMQLKLMGLMEDLKQEEKGSQMVEIAVLVVIVLLVAATLKKGLGDAVTDATNKLSNFIKDTNVTIE